MNIKDVTGLTVDPDSLFDIQAKRIHEYKRQHLNVLHIITLYNHLLRYPHTYFPPRTFIFGGKAAPGYYMAKLMIRLINAVGSVVNNDPRANDRLKVVFFPDFNVKNGQQFYAAADLSEQISTAGKEASGTGNMKFALNGALTIGTLDGANVEIREEVGADNFFLFGMTVEEVQERKAAGYRPSELLAGDEELSHAIQMIADGAFSNGDRNVFAPIVGSLVHHDEYMLFADYRSYIERQKQVSEVYADEDRWTLMSILNVARMGRFSSDRAIREYCKDIWKTEPTEVIAGHTSALRKPKLPS